MIGVMGRLESKDGELEHSNEGRREGGGASKPKRPDRITGSADNTRHGNGRRTAHTFICH
jgi:hypothetical protein